MTVVDALLMGVAAIALVWVLWKGLSLHAVGLRRHRKKHARERLVEGLEALQQGTGARREGLVAGRPAAARRPQRSRRDCPPSHAHDAADARATTTPSRPHLDCPRRRTPTGRGHCARATAARCRTFESALDTLDTAPQPLRRADWRCARRRWRHGPQRRGVRTAGPHCASSMRFRPRNWASGIELGRGGAA